MFNTFGQAYEQYKAYLPIYRKANLQTRAATLLFPRWHNRGIADFLGRSYATTMHTLQGRIKLRREDANAIGTLAKERAIELWEVGEGLHNLADSEVARVWGANRTNAKHPARTKQDAKKVEL